MPRKPADHQLADVIAGLIVDLRTLITVAPIVAAQSKRERLELTGGLPTSDRGERIDDPYTGPGDPTGEAAVAGPQWGPAGSTSPARDVERLEQWTHDLVRLVGSSRALLDQAPAVTRSVVAGRKPTDGRSQAEWEQRKFVHATESEAACVACDEPTSTVGRLKAGLCSTDYKAWQRARVTDPLLERSLWLIDRRAWLAEQADRDGVLVEGPWGHGQERRAA